MKKHFAALPVTEDERLILEPEVRARVPFHRSTLWRKVQDGTFPAPIRIATNRNAWRLSAILRWIQEREEHPIAQRAYFGKKAADREDVQPKPPSKHVPPNGRTSTRVTGQHVEAD